MNFRWLLLFSIMLSANAQSNQFPTQIIEQFDDVNIVAFINEDDVNNSEAWNPLNDAPPVSIANAIKALKKQYIQDHATPDSLLITEIELRQIPLHKNHWHYLIKTKSKVAGKSKNAFYAVLMNGKIIHAIVEPKSFK